MIVPSPKIGDRFDTLEVVDAYMTGSKSRRVVLRCAQCGFNENMDFRTLHERQGNINRGNKKKLFCPCCSNIGFIRGTAEIIGIVKTNTTASNSTYKIRHSCCGAHEEITKHTLIKRSDSIRRGCRFCNQSIDKIFENPHSVRKTGCRIYVPVNQDLMDISILRLGGQPGHINMAFLSSVLSESGI